MKAVEVIQKPGTEIFWAGDEIVGVAAIDESTADDAVRAIKIEYEVLPHFVSDAEPPKNIAPNRAPSARTTSSRLEENQVPDEEVIASIKHRGISFTPDEKWIKGMDGEGVDPKVIAALNAAKVAAAVGRQISVQAHRHSEPGRSRQSVCLGRRHA